MNALGTMDFSLIATLLISALGHLSSFIQLYGQGLCDDKQRSSHSLSGSEWLWPANPFLGSLTDFILDSVNCISFHDCISDPDCDTIKSQRNKAYVIHAPGLFVSLTLGATQEKGGPHEKPLPRPTNQSDKGNTSDLDKFVSTEPQRG